MIILRLLLLLTNLHLKLLSTQGTGADKLLSTQRVKRLSLYVTHSFVDEGEQKYTKIIFLANHGHKRFLYNILL